MNLKVVVRILNAEFFFFFPEKKFLVFFLLFSLERVFLRHGKD